MPHTLQEWAVERGLTPAELRVIQHAVRGLANKEVAAALEISPSTVRTHLEKICRKLAICSRGELAYLVFTVIESATARLARHRERLVQELEAERASLDRERTLLAEVLRQSPVAIMVADPASRSIVLVNEAAARFLGHAIPADVAALDEPFGRALSRALDGEDLAVSEAEHRRCDGQLTVLEVAARPIRQRTGELCAALLAFSDVTARHRAET